MTYKEVTFKTHVGYTFYMGDSGDDELLLIGMADADGKTLALVLDREEAEDFASLILSGCKHIKYRKDDTTSN